MWLPSRLSLHLRSACCFEYVLSTTTLRRSSTPFICSSFHSYSRYFTASRKTARVICADDARPVAIWSRDLRLHATRERCTADSSAIHSSPRVVRRHPLRLAHRPRYVALSYMWGPPTSAYSVLVDGKRLNIRENLFHFLEEACHMKDQYIWIDQICINQDDIPERGQQVGLMGKIYRQAACSIIWLGNDERYPQAARNVNAGPEMDPETRDESLLLLLRDPYFTRLWIIQEFLLPRDVTFFIRRDIQISWPTMRKHLPDLKLVDIIGKHKDLSCLFLLHKRGYQRPPKLVLQDLAMYGLCACQEPLDKVYGLLGLSDQPIPFDIDYTRSVHSVFDDVLRFAAQQYLPTPDDDQQYFWLPIELIAWNLKLIVSSNFRSMCKRAFSDLLLLSGQKDFNTIKWDVRLELDSSGSLDRTKPRGEWEHLVRDKLLVEIEGETQSYHYDFNTKEVVVNTGLKADVDA